MFSKLLQLTLALLMAWSGCFCQVACGLELCEHEHHPGESSCDDEGHHHEDHGHEGEEGDDPPESGCEHPEASDRNLPNPPQADAGAYGVIQEVGKMVWPSVDRATPLAGGGVPPDPLTLRDQVTMARLCRFLI